jgi:hypothetical protein
MNLSFLFVIITQVIASLCFVITGSSYEKAMIPLFFAVLMAILWVLTNINDKLKPL